MKTFHPILILWYILPIILFFASRLTIKSLGLNHKLSIKAPDLMVPFLFFGIQKLSQDTFGQSMFPYLFISLLLLGIGLVFFQAYYYDEVDYLRYFKMYWRSIFIITSLTYFLLIIVNLISHL